MAGIEQQVHPHLVELRRQAFHQRQLGKPALQGDLVLELVPDDVDRRFQPGVQVDPAPGLAAAGIGKVLQVTHDPGHPLDPLARFGQQLRQVAGDEVDVQTGADLLDLRQQLLRIGGMQRTFVGLDHGEQAAQVLLQAAQVGMHVADRVVDLMRHTGSQLADGGHFFRLQQLFLGTVQAQIGLAQLGMPLQQLAFIILVAFDFMHQGQVPGHPVVGVMGQVGNHHPFADRQRAIPAARLTRQQQHLLVQLQQRPTIRLQQLADVRAGQRHRAVFAEHQHAVIAAFGQRLQNLDGRQVDAGGEIKLEHGQAGSVDSPRP